MKVHFICHAEKLRAYYQVLGTVPKITVYTQVVHTNSLLCCLIKSLPCALTFND